MYRRVISFILCVCLVFSFAVLRPQPVKAIAATATIVAASLAAFLAAAGIYVSTAGASAAYTENFFDDYVSRNSNYSLSDIAAAAGTSGIAATMFGPSVGFRIGPEIAAIFQSTAASWFNGKANNATYSNAPVTFTVGGNNYRYSSFDGNYNEPIITSFGSVLCSFVVPFVETGDYVSAYQFTDVNGTPWDVRYKVINSSQTFSKIMVRVFDSRGIALNTSTTTTQSAFIGVDSAQAVSIYVCPYVNSSTGICSSALLYRAVSNAGTYTVRTACRTLDAGVILTNTAQAAIATGSVSIPDAVANPSKNYDVIVPGLFDPDALAEDVLSDVSAGNLDGTAGYQGEFTDVIIPTPPPTVTDPDIFTSVWESVLDWLNDFWSALRSFFQQYWDAIVEWFDQVLDELIAFKDAVIDWFEDLLETLEDILAAIIEWLQDIFEAIQGILTAILDWISDGIVLAWSGLQDIIERLFEWIRDLLRALGDAIWTLYNAIITELRNLLNFHTPWHYVTEWIASIRSFVMFTLSIWGVLPSAMVLPVWAMLVIVITFALFKKLF